jgi:hypothetical protein
MSSPKRKGIDLWVERLNGFPSGATDAALSNMGLELNFIL